MRKNLLTLITFVLTLVNLVLTAVIALTIVPEVNNVNELIGRISQAIDLDIASGNEHQANSSNISLDSVTPYTLADNVTVNLKMGPDGAEHIAVAGITVLVNNASSAKETYPELSEYDNVIRAQVNTTISKYTMDELRNSQDKVCEEIMEALNQMFGGDLITSVQFSTFNVQ